MPTNETQAFTKSINMNISVVRTLNQLFIRGSFTEIKFSRKKAASKVAKLDSLWYVHFELPILFILTLTSDKVAFIEMWRFSL